MMVLHRSQTGRFAFRVLAFALLAVVVGLPVAPAFGDHGHKRPTPESRCETEKVKAAGRYARCLSETIAHARIKRLDPSDYEVMIERCDEKFDRAFTRAEAVGECRTAGGPSGIRDSIRVQMEATSVDIASGPGCPTDNLTVIAGETATCKVSTNNSAIDLAAIVDQLSGEGVSQDTIVWIQAWGADGGAGAEKNGGGGGMGGYAQMITTVKDFLSNFGVTEIYYYLGNDGTNVTGSGGSGGAATLVSTTDLSQNEANFSTMVLVAGGGGGGGGGRGPKTDVCGKAPYGPYYDDVLGGYGGTGGIAIASTFAIGLGHGQQGPPRRNEYWSGAGGGGNLEGEGGNNGGGSAKDGDSGYAGLGGVGGGMSSDPVGFVNKQGTMITLHGGQGGGPGDSAGGGGGGGGLGGGGGGHEGDGDSDCVAGGGGGGGSLAAQSDEECSAAPTSPPSNPNGSEGFVQIVFDLGACSGT